MNEDAKSLRKAPLKTPTDPGADATRDIAGAHNDLLADIYALYFKTKNFHWHVSGRHFRDYHILGVGVEYAYTMIHGAPATRVPEFKLPAAGVAVGA